MQLPGHSAAASITSFLPWEVVTAMHDYNLVLREERYRAAPALLRAVRTGGALRGDAN